MWKPGCKAGLLLSDAPLRQACMVAGSLMKAGKFSRCVGRAFTTLTLAPRRDRDRHNLPEFLRSTLDVFHTFRLHLALRK